VIRLNRIRDTGKVNLRWANNTVFVHWNLSRNVNALSDPIACPVLVWQLAWSSGIMCVVKASIEVLTVSASGGSRNIILGWDLTYCNFSHQKPILIIDISPRDTEEMDSIARHATQHTPPLISLWRAIAFGDTTSYEHYARSQVQQALPCDEPFCQRDPGVICLFRFPSSYG